MSSDVQICNGALLKLGADTILALTDNNNRARVMNARYEPVRDAELQRRRWRFSVLRAKLPALAATPLFEYGYQYQLPGDFLRLLEGGDIRTLADLSDYRVSACALYTIEGDKLLTSLTPPLSIRYIARVTDVGLYHPAFCEALSARLAWENCERLTQSDSKRQLAQSDYKEAIREAVRAQALETASQSIADDSWVLTRAQ